MRGVVVLVLCALAVGASRSKGPCDIYAAANTPCVAAHSTVRALYASYSGPLYELHRDTDNATRMVSVDAGTGFADAASQPDFCTPDAYCSIRRIFDQSGRNNHLIVVNTTSEGGANNRYGWPVRGPNAMRDRLSAAGHTVYSAYFEGGQGTGSGTMGFRASPGNGTAVDDDPESVYMVTAGRHFSRGCCFDYGNSETRNNAASNSPGQMEAINWGNGFGGAFHPGKPDASDPDNVPGPHVMADLENGVWAGDNAAVNPTNTDVHARFVTAMLKGGPAGGNHWQIKGGDAQRGDALRTLFDGNRPDGYSPMHKQGAIVLGIGGDNSDFGVGTFYEGAMTANYTSDATDAAVHANIAAAGYGK